MVFNPDIHHRRSIRLPDYDYSREGAYFVTICAHERECLFGEAGDGRVVMNSNGRIVLEAWHDLPQHYPQVALDSFVVMPNHVHGIIVINNPVGAQFIAPESANPAPGHRGALNQGAMNRAPTVGAIVRAFKARCTHAINQSRNAPGVPVWQRNYYERVIRDDRELAGIRQYIAENPVRWEEDINHPTRVV